MFIMFESFDLKLATSWFERVLELTQFDSALRVLESRSGSSRPVGVLIKAMFSGVITLS